MKTLQALANEIEIVLLPFDTEWKKQQIEWFANRKQALKQYRAETKVGNWDYRTMFEIMGGKTNYMMESSEFARKLDLTSKARNERIAAKILAAGDKETIVESGEIVRTGDGFNGKFALNTNSGKKIITIDTIFAGGYNIQCAHIRTLIKVK